VVAEVTPTKVTLAAVAETLVTRAVVTPVVEVATLAVAEETLVTRAAVTPVAEAVTLAAAEATQEKVADRRNNLRVLS